VPQELFDKLAVIKAEIEANEGTRWTKKSVLSQVQTDAHRNQSDKDKFFRTLKSRMDNKQFYKYAVEIFGLTNDSTQNRANVLAQFNSLVKAKRLERKEVDKRFEATKSEIAMNAIQRQALAAGADMDRQIRRYSAQEKLKIEIKKINTELK
jgi:hypothetical protein